MASYASLPLPVMPLYGRRATDGLPLQSRMAGGAELALRFVAGLVFALLAGVLLNQTPEPTRALAALLAVSGFVYVGAALRAGHGLLMLASVFTLAGLTTLAWLGLGAGPLLLALGFWLHASWSLGFAVALNGSPRAWLSGWLGLQLGFAFIAML